MGKIYKRVELDEYSIDNHIFDQVISSIINPLLHTHNIHILLAFTNEH